MKVKQIKQRGELVWLVDGRVNGKRQRMFFDTKPQAERWLKAESKDTTAQQWWLGLTNGDRADMMDAFERSRDIGFTLRSAVDYFETQGRGNKFLKKCTLGDALGTTGPDKRHKNWEQQPKATGFLGSKVRMGVARASLSTLKSLMYDFRDYIGADTQVATISPEMIESWVDEGGVRGGDWATITKATSLKRIRGFFTWCIKKDFLSTNPGAKLEGFILDDSEPCYLKLDQVIEFLEITRKHDPELLTPAALNLFCGIRPSEVRRMTQANISIADREIELKGKQTKTRRRRFVDISDNCLEWLKLGGKMPLPNLNHRWHTLIAEAKAEMGFDKWPHDCLRHSYCSYYLAAHENAAKAALQAGHTESILFRHYRKLVKKEQAEKFWNIYPEDAQDQFKVVAA
ncbi:MAG: hypothetical protein QGF29_07090 [Verrucomicrobiota bacterium]|jgi:integrase|nr:hypothetical protein [Verrucomicrobiota bacterium]